MGFYRHLRFSHSSWAAPPALLLSCCSLPSVALLRFSYLWFSVVSRRFRRTLLSPLPGGLPVICPLSSMGRSQPQVIVEVVAPVALLPGIALYSGIIVRYGRLVEKMWSCRGHPSLVLLGSLAFVSRVSFTSLGYSYLHSPWRQLRAPHLLSPPPRGVTSFGRVVLLHCLGNSGWTWAELIREGLLLVVP